MNAELLKAAFILTALCCFFLIQYHQKIVILSKQYIVRLILRKSGLGIKSKNIRL